MLLGTRYVRVHAIPARFDTHAITYVAVDREHPSELVAVRVFENVGPFRHALHVTRTLQAAPETRDFVVPTLASETSNGDTLLYHYDAYCFESLRDVAWLPLEVYRNYLFQALFGIYAVHLFAGLTHGNVHAGNLLFYRERGVAGRLYTDDGDMWEVPFQTSVRWSDFAHARPDPQNPTDVIALARAFGAVQLCEAQRTDEAHLADLLERMVCHAPFDALLRHAFFEPFRRAA